MGKLIDKNERVTKNLNAINIQKKFRDGKIKRKKTII